ncbi:MAG TPA: UDP-2,4-diacetamido-2,4,6-trideoxy-beta-L-altropyranose hydrolase [Chitinophagaceae bacterium]|nr:UDP-2,4-diacetamido-2,4,6-trideoxy-beta-L-altropyranose hydrolase [Chitinophagaceae bacterium]
MQTRVYIRADGSTNIGLGHLVRCIALAQMLKNEFDIYFVSRQAPTNIIKEVEQSGFGFSTIETEESFFGMLSGKEIVVIDNYYFETDYQKKIKDLGCKLVCIDDLHDKEFYADLIINQVPGTKPADYKAQFYTQFALGPDYALLRTSFLEQARKQKKIDKIESVFICFGGSDSKNLTTKTLELILDEKRFKKIIVITGVAFNYMDKLQPTIEKDSRVQHYHGVNEDEMVELMEMSDLAIVPASGILLEAIAVGCIVISGMYVDNQKFVFEEYKKAGLFESAENFSKQHLIKAIDKVFSLPFANDKIIDGCSAQRISKCFRQLAMEDQIIMRSMAETDVQKTFEWASDPRIRTFSFSKEIIRYKEHAAWFLNKIKNDSCYYFIGEINGHSIGSIRFDINGKEATISYLLDPNFHNMGLGIALLKKGVAFFKANEKKEIDRVIGFVMPENIASVKAFERLGYSKQIENNNFKFTKSLK